MKPDEQVARFCKLCGRQLEGPEKLTAICVRCKTLGNREGALDVEDAFGRALTRFAVDRNSLTGNRYGVASCVLILFVVVVAFCSILAWGEMGVIDRVVTICLPIEILGLLLAVVGLLARGTNRVLAVIGLVISVAFLLLFLTHLDATVGGAELTGGNYWTELKQLLSALLK